MSNVAASGGYYISCMADKILAEENTVTGSIGVIGMLFESGEFFSDRLGITFDTVKTTKYSDFPTSILVNRQVTEDEGNIITKAIQDLYKHFKQRVADGRNMNVDDVEQLARGRVWTGIDAKELGLVDEIGGLDEAIEIAAELAGLEEDNYRLRSYPQKKDPYQKLMEEFLGGGESTKKRMMKQELGQFYKYYEQLLSLQNMKGAQFRMPFTFEVK